MHSKLPSTPAARKRALVERREHKMASSAHAYVRGSTERFYEWLSTARGKSLPSAPAIWICGDCHAGNIGPIAHADGSVDIQVRDLDQTVIGSPAHDVIRFALSMAMAARASRLPGASTLEIIEAIARGYSGALEAFAGTGEFTAVVPPEEIKSVYYAAKKRSSRDLFGERLGGERRTIPLGAKFWPLTKTERASVERLVASEEIRDLAAALAPGEPRAKIELVDVAYWVKGCSSLGLFRAAALIEVKTKKQREIRLLDIKEAKTALAPHSKKGKLPRHMGERVVSGARKLAPNLGERMAFADVAGHPVFIRELLPQDLKFDLDLMTARSAPKVAEYLGSVIALAHGRQLTPALAKRWLRSFRKTVAKGTEAPAWLWAAVVDLVAIHEGAYLEYCRSHAPRKKKQARRAARAIVERKIASHHTDNEPKS